MVDVARTLREAGIPPFVQFSNLNDTDAPSHLSVCADDLGNGVDDYCHGLILIADDCSNVKYALRAFATLAKELALAQLNVWYESPLQLISKSKADDPDEKEYLLETDHLFVPMFYVAGQPCPYSLEDRNYLLEILLGRFYNQTSTSILSFGSFLDDNEWYGEHLVSLFYDHPEVNINV